MLSTYHTFTLFFLHLYLLSFSVYFFLCLRSCKMCVDDRTVEFCCLVAQDSRLSLRCNHEKEYSYQHFIYQRKFLLHNFHSCISHHLLKMCEGVNMILYDNVSERINTLTRRADVHIKTN